MSHRFRADFRPFAPAPICLVAGLLIGILTGDLGLWICVGVAVGAVLTGRLASETGR